MATDHAAMSQKNAPITITWAAYGAPDPREVPVARYALILEGTVDNVAETDPDSDGGQQWLAAMADDYAVVEVDETVQTGDSYDGKTFTPNAAAPDPLVAALGELRAATTLKASNAAVAAIVDALT